MVLYLFQHRLPPEFAQILKKLYIQDTEEFSLQLEVVWAKALTVQ